MKKITLTMKPDRPLNRIAPEIYGHFAEHLGRCIYDGIYVGEDSDIPNTNGMRDEAVQALRELQIPVLRWPGGCFAEEYHWMDGIGPREKRKRRINSNWGSVIENNHFGTHEFMELCHQLGCQPYIAVNLGSGTVQEAAEWVEYMTSDSDSYLANLRRQNGRNEPWKVKYLGIGNENWGAGGSMTPDFYASEYKRYQQFCKEYSGNTLYKIACGPNADDYAWTRGLMSRINQWHAKGISLHYYTIPGDWEHKGSAAIFDEKEYYTTISRALYIEEIIEKHLEIMKAYDSEHHISLVVDEWGTWYDVEPGTNPGFLYQQNTMRDAIVAACSLNIFNKHSDYIAMANIAQTVNVLQAMLLTQGGQLIKTPTYEVFRMFREHQGANLVESRAENISTDYGEISVPTLSESVSVTTENGMRQINATFVNTSLSDDCEVELVLPSELKFHGQSSVMLLHGDAHAHNTFENPECVTVQETRQNSDGLNKQTVTLPPCSVCRIRCQI